MLRGVSDESLRGQLLVASPALVEPTFARTVILVGEHSGEGAMGVVLNRPSEADVEDAVPALVAVVGSGTRLHVGGPVQPSALTVLAEFDDPDDAATIVFADIGFARGDDDMTLLAGATRRARAFAGYSGWAPGQLDAELRREDWIVAAPAPDDVFSDEGVGLWSTVLRRMGGRYELIARMPIDPSVN
jgi:putative transcriptional regulator